MNIDWEKIKKNYPKSYEKFISKIFPFDVDDFKTSYLTPICYCNIEKFFDKNGIFIEMFSQRTVEARYWNYEIKINEDVPQCDEIRMGSGTLFSDGKKMLTRLETQTESVYKAFEIMENSI